MFCGEGACADTGGVGFQHTDHMVEPTIRDAGPQRRIGGQRIGAGREGEDAVVDVPHGTQLSFQHDALAAVVGLLQKAPTSQMNGANRSAWVLHQSSSAS